MSPVPPHVVETERVQGPLTLSETCTWPDALYWPNHPTRRSPARTGLLSVSLDDVRREAGEAPTPWSNSGDTAGVGAGGGAGGTESSSRRSKGAAQNRASGGGGR